MIPPTRSDNSASLVWFRQDLRTDDHPALAQAARAGGAVLPVFIWSPEGQGRWAPGAAFRWWTHENLRALSSSLETLGSRLLLRSGPPERVLAELASEAGAVRVLAHRRVEPACREEERRVAEALERAGVRLELLDEAMLFDPAKVRNLSGQPFRVFTHFWNKCLSTEAPPAPQAVPRRLEAPKKWPGSGSLKDLGLEPRIPWNAGMKALWAPGERAASERIRDFGRRGVADYARDRDLPALEGGVSGISPYLAVGALGSRRAWQEIERLHGPRTDAAKQVYLRQLGWREFARHLLWHFPHTVYRPLHEEFESFPWEKRTAELRAWRRGATGYPIVDAGMRQLWSTGWMHNRVRMIAGSFLVKDLLVDWLEGARWFWDTLIDADLANNTLGWQWVAGCGADAAPFFRIFNPVTQGEKFDPRGEYVRRWVPELAGVPDARVHHPREEGGDLLAGARAAYPRPIVDHTRARERALAVFQNRGRVKAARRTGGAA